MTDENERDDEEVGEEETQSQTQTEHLQLPAKQSTTASIPIGADGLQFRNFGDMWSFANCWARSGLATRDSQRPESVMIIVQLGAELFGFSAMQSLQSFHVVKGKLGTPGMTAKALVEASPLCEYIDESFTHDVFPVDLKDWPDDLAAVCVGKRKNRPESTAYRFSVGDAKRAGLWGKVGAKGPSAWVTYPQRMLRMRARGFCLADVFPDILKGVKLEEELWDTPEQGRLASGTVLAATDLDEVAAKLAQEELENDEGSA